MSFKINSAANKLQQIIADANLGVQVDVEIRKGGTVLIVRISDEVEAKNDFEMYAPSRGYEADWLGKTFREKRTHFTVTGVNPTATKNVLSITDQNGKVYGCPVGFVRRHLQAVGAIA